MALDHIDFVGNPNQRTPCILVLDTSGSMDGDPIEELNEGIKAFHQALTDDTHALTHVSIAIVTAGGSNAELLMDWTDATGFSPVPMKGDGPTPLGEALILALDLIEQVKAGYRSNGIQYTRPWLFFMTDGEPTDSPEVWAEAIRRCREAEMGKKAVIFPIAVQRGNVAKIGQTSSRSPVKLTGLNFKEFFVWLSGSLGQASRTAPGTDIQLPSLDSWGSVQS
jgi:uncharacterized protein YegL